MGTETASTAAAINGAHAAKRSPPCQVFAMRPWCIEERANHDAIHPSATATSAMVSSTPCVEPPVKAQSAPVITQPPIISPALQSVSGAGSSPLLRVAFCGAGTLPRPFTARHTRRMMRKSTMGQVTQDHTMSAALDRSS